MIKCIAFKFIISEREESSFPAERLNSPPLQHTRWPTSGEQGAQGQASNTLPQVWLN